jgi:flagellar hook-length control protein FliK
MPAIRGAEIRRVDPVADAAVPPVDSARASAGAEMAPSHGIDGTISSSTGHLVRKGGAEYATVSPVQDQVALHLSKALDDGRTEIRIHLRPAELGDVDIRLEFHDLRLTATVSAERAETLDLLQRDARGLARAFREAGVDIDQSGLSFTHGGRGGHAGDRMDDQHNPATLAVTPDEPDAIPLPAQMVHSALLGSWDGRVDVLV